MNLYWLPKIIAETGCDEALNASRAFASLEETGKALNGIAEGNLDTKCAATRDLVSDSGLETPVPALFLSRGFLSTPSSRLGPGASKLGLSAISFGNQYKKKVQEAKKTLVSAREIRYPTKYPSKTTQKGLQLC